MQKIKERTEIIFDLEKEIWESKIQALIIKWDNYTDKLPLGCWKDLDSAKIENSIVLAECLLEEYNIGGRIEYTITNNNTNFNNGPYFLYKDDIRRKDERK